MNERVPCEQSPDCKYFEVGCWEDIHHLFYPRGDYDTPLEHKFRNLPENKQQICRYEHERIHFEQLPPTKPSFEVMEHAVSIAGIKLTRRQRKASRL